MSATAVSRYGPGPERIGSVTKQLRQGRDTIRWFYTCWGGMRRFRGHGLVEVGRPLDIPGVAAGGGRRGRQSATQSGWPAVMDSRVLRAGVHRAGRAAGPTSGPGRRGDGQDVTAPVPAAGTGIGGADGDDRPGDAGRVRAADPAGVRGRRAAAPPG